MARRLLGTAVTDENGEATFEYVGEGAGELHIVAESGTFSSNVIVVDDYTPIIASATITSDKNIIQSGGSANLTIIGKDKHNELVNSDTFDLCEQFIISKVSLNSNGIVQSGNTLDIKAKVNTSLGGIPNNVPVVFKKGDEVLNTVQTSTNGVATYGYQGSGVGQVNITAECDGVVSGTLPVLDYLWYDKAIGEHKSSNYTGITVNVTDSDNGMVLSATADSGTRYCNTVVGGTNTWFDSSKSYQVEFDFSYEQQTGSAVGCGFGNNGLNFHNLFSGATSGSGHLKIITSGNTYQVYLNNVARGSPISITGTNGLFFLVYKTGSLTLSNISILEI